MHEPDHWHQQYSIQYLIANPDIAKRVDHDCEKPFVNKNMFGNRCQLNCLAAYEAIKIGSKKLIEGNSYG